MILVTAPHLLMTTLLANIIVSQVIEHPKTTENISVLGKPSKKKSLTFVKPPPDPPLVTRKKKDTTKIVPLKITF